jgi:ribose/xylose/arabinose/galactoside ABC-type transport system permease subunit
VFAVAAVIVFILGLILNLLGVGYNWPLVFLGLALLAAHLVWSWTPWARHPG